MKLSKTDSDLWTPLRVKQLGKVTESSFDGVSWDPNEIINASELLINITAIQKLLTAIESNREIRLASLQKRSDSNQPQISSISPSGDATASNKTQKTENPNKPTVTINPDENSPWILAVDFAGIAEFVRNNNDNQIIPDKMADLADQQFRQASRKIITNNYISKVLENDEDDEYHMMFEIMSVIYLMVTLVYQITLSLTFLALGKLKPETLLAISPLIIMEQFAAYMFLTLAALRAKKLEPNDENSKSRKKILYDYKIHMLEHFQNNDFRPAFYPVELVHLLVIPLLNSLVRRKKFLRGKQD